MATYIKQMAGKFALDICQGCNATPLRETKTKQAPLLHVPRYCTGPVVAARDPRRAGGPTNDH